MAIMYRGTTIPFGRHTNETAERAKKVIVFPAVDGTQEMHMGKRQKSFSITGRIVDFTGAFNKQTIETWNDTSYGTLILHGTSYTYVSMARCSFSDVYTDKCTGKMGCTFTMELKKLR